MLEIHFLKEDNESFTDQSVKNVDKNKKVKYPDGNRVFLGCSDAFFMNIQ